MAHKRLKLPTPPPYVVDDSSSSEEEELSDSSEKRINDLIGIKDLPRTSSTKRPICQGDCGDSRRVEKRKRSESKSPVRSNRGNGSFDGVVAHPDESKVDNPERSFLPTSPAKIQSGTAVNTENSVDENKIDPDQCKGILQKMWDAKTADGSVVQWSEEGPQLMVDIAYEVIQDEREEMYFKEVLIPRFLNDSNELLEPILGTLTNAAAALSWFRELASKVNPSFQNGTPTSTPSKLVGTPKKIPFKLGEKRLVVTTVSEMFEKLKANPQPYEDPLVHIFKCVQTEDWKTDAGIHGTLVDLYNELAKKKGLPERPGQSLKTCFKRFAVGFAKAETEAKQKKNLSQFIANDIEEKNFIQVLTKYNSSKSTRAPRKVDCKKNQNTTAPSKLDNNENQ